MLGTVSNGAGTSVARRVVTIFPSTSSSSTTRATLGSRFYSTHRLAGYEEHKLKPFEMTENERARYQAEINDRVKQTKTTPSALRAVTLTRYSIPERYDIPSHYSIWSKIMVRFSEIQLRFMTWREGRKLKKVIGQSWRSDLETEAMGMYSAVQKAMSTGHIRPLYQHASEDLLNDLKIWSKTRKGILKTHRIDWRLHEYQTPQISMLVSQETGAGMYPVEAVIRLRTKQSVEVRDLNNKLVAGSHKHPESKVESWSFIRNMAKPNEGWIINTMKQDGKIENLPIDPKLPFPTWFKVTAGLGGAGLLFIFLPPFF